MFVCAAWPSMLQSGCITGRAFPAIVVDADVATTLHVQALTRSDASSLEIDFNSNF